MKSPLIKWSGSKRSQVSEIQSRLPERIRTYWEPFVGGANVVGNLMMAADRVVVSDAMPVLIDFYRLFQASPDAILTHYTENWQHYQNNREHFYFVRNRFNQLRDAKDLFFLSRTSHNGLIRFNRKGEFNASIMHNRGGMHPDHVREVFDEWRGALTGVEFECGDYRSILQNVGSGDFVYCDPPYVSDNILYGAYSFNVVEFAEELSRLNRIGAKWLCSYFGNGHPNLDGVSKHRYITHTGLSSFRRLNRAGDVQIDDSLYLNYVQN